MKKVLISLLIVAGFAFTACNSGGWSSTEKDEYTKKCKEGLKGVIDDEAAKGYCDCTLEALEKEFSNLNDASKDPEKMQEAIKPCLEKLKAE